MRKYARGWYNKNSENRRLVVKNIRLALAAMVQEIKATTPCADCGIQYHPCAMDFDHREGEIKEGHVSELVRGRGRDKVLAEIAKCDVVCAICHRLRSYRRQFPDRSISDFNEGSSMDDKAADTARRVRVLENIVEALVKHVIAGKVGNTTGVLLQENDLNELLEKLPD